MNDEDKAIFVARTISSWRGKSENVSLDKRVYMSFFSTLKPVHTVHDKKTRDPIFILVNRKDAIESAKKVYNLKTKGDPLPGNTPVNYEAGAIKE